MVEDKTDRIAFLKKVSIFAGMNEQELTKLDSIVEVSEHDADDVIFKQDSDGKALFIVRNGKVLIVQHLDVEEEEKRIISMGPGDIFGEFALIDGGPRSAGAVAGEACTLYRIAMGQFDSFTRREPFVGLKLVWGIAQVLSRRVRMSNDRLKSMIMWGK